MGVLELFRCCMNKNLEDWLYILSLEKRESVLALRSRTELCVYVATFPEQMGCSYREKL